MKHSILLLFFVLVSGLGFAQTIEEIKQNPNYLWGTGKGMSLTEADRNALADLLSQISTNVSSETKAYVEDVQTNASETYKKEFFSTINTYSASTLNNTKRLTISNEPDAEVFRYIEKREIKKIFEARKRKIIDFYNYALKYEEEGKIADAIKYAYWGNLLLKSHPYSFEISIETAEGQRKFLNSEFPLFINNLFQNIDFTIDEIVGDDNFKTLVLSIAYKNQPINNLDYHYWDGVDWSAVYSAKDGTGVVELSGVSTTLENLKVKVEYEFYHEARIDKEVEGVLKQVTPMPFPKSYLNFNLLKEAGKKETKNKANKELQKIVEGFTSIHVSNKNDLFTKNGLQAYTKLLGYGEAKLISKENLSEYEFNGKRYIRGLEYLFSFSGNKKFVESVVLEVDSENKIDNINFSLSQTAVQSIDARPWEDDFKKTIIHFLESYKTAYALKRIDYISSIFADDAVIITGYMVNLEPVADLYSDNKIIKYNKYTKKEFLDNLKYSFSSKEYINLKFEESEVLQSGINKNQFGIQIKQSYFSSNYGDQGYLFLLVEFNEEKVPTINVRTWQPEKSTDGSIYGLGDF